ncbi:MAG: phosphate ABC transporter ATP-binding protein PstB [Actinomycetota bacterium]
MSSRVEIRKLSAFYGARKAIEDVTLAIEPKTVTAIIGPSGCGKSTLVRCVNRLHEVIPGAYVEGSVMLDDQDIYASGVDPVDIRRRIGMVFQRPNPFPTMSIFENAAAGYRLNMRVSKTEMKEIVEQSLSGAGLYEEVKGRLDAPASSLSGGQQQRLCIARAIAVEPDVLLMDEPCSALDPSATLRIEDLITDLKEQYTIVRVTHNMQQAARVADRTVFMLSEESGQPGPLVETGATDQIFTRPSDSRTEAYITGRFG